jgi:hypothetical protein
MKKPELTILIGPSGDNTLRGVCSACRDATFTYPTHSEENHKLMQKAFAKHFRMVHLREDASQAAARIVREATK